MPYNDNVGKLYDTFREYDSPQEAGRRRDLLDLFRRCPIPDEDILSNLFLYLPKVEIARFLYRHEVYRKALDVPGVIMEFGVRWGRGIALFEAFRAIYEPFNRTRKIIGFDTFQGIPSVSDKDGDASPGEYSVTPDYQKYLAELLETREREGAPTQPKRFELVNGDASVTVREYLDDHPETIISLAFLDLASYTAAKAIMEVIQPYLARGSVISAGLLAEEHFPGETVAVREVLGLNNVRLVHTPYSSAWGYFLYG